MFNKKNQDDDDSRISPPLRLGETQPIRSKNVSVIGPTLVFKGELSADEDLVIEGTIEGTIAHHKKNLTIGAKGRVKADITRARCSSKASSMATFTATGWCRWPRARP